jgi:hypothetical protein
MTHENQELAIVGAAQDLKSLVSFNLKYLASKRPPLDFRPNPRGLCACSNLKLTLVRIKGLLYLFALVQSLMDNHCHKATEEIDKKLGNDLHVRLVTDL